MEDDSSVARQARLPARGVVLLGLFFLSGVSALAYQSIWQRMLGLIAGSDAVAATLIVGAFLFGLGIGSMLGAAVADRLSPRAAVLGFAGCEIGIGVIGAASRFLFHDLMFDTLAPVLTSPGVTFLAIVLVLLPPTVLMGLSLPLLARVIVRAIESASRHIGWLYGLNTLGAAVGSALAGCVVIPAVGYEVTAWLAGAINIAIGLIALAGAPAMAGMEAAPNTAPRKPAPPAVKRASVGMGEWCVVVFVSGFLIISLEIIWFRVLGMMMQANAYYFSIVLTVFLLGDALGIIVGAELVRHIAAPRRWFLRLQGAVALYALFSLAALSYAEGWYGLWPALAEATHQIRASRFSMFAAYTALTVFVVLVPAFLLGLSFPLVHKAVQDDPRLVGTRVGWIQLANILGNTAGAVVTGLALLHLLGTTGSLWLLALIGAAMTLWPLWRGTRREPRAVPLALVAALALAALILPGQTSFWSRLHGVQPGPHVSVSEDRTGVVVLRPASMPERRSYGLSPDLPDARLMFILGHAQSGIPFLEHHGMLGMIGPLIHPAPRHVLVIGHGAGGTPYGVAINPRPEHITVVEIIGPVFTLLRALAGDAGSAKISETIRAMLADKRVTHRVADARHVLRVNAERYDVIEADAIYPWSSHAGVLYSREFFQQVRARLNPGGIFVQWAATERTRDTFLSVFPHVMHVGLALLGSNDPTAFDAARLRDAINPQMVSRMREAGWRVDVMLSGLLDRPPRVWGPADARRLDDLNTDLFPRDEYGLARR